MPLPQDHCSISGVELRTGGTVLYKETAQSRGAWFSVVRRNVPKIMDWEIKSTLPALIWMRRGFRRVSLDLGSRPEQVTPLVRPAMVFVPGGSNLKLNVVVEGDASYAAVFFKPSPLVDAGSAIASADPMVNFQHRELEQSLVSLSREIARPDNLFNMLAEGWTLQALAHLSRKGQDCTGRQSRHVGGLSRTNQRRLEEYIRVHFCESIALDDLAHVVGFTTRHLSRAFRATFSETPMQHIMTLRMEKASRMLIETQAPITQVALDCGFSHAQHFAASFSRAVGCSPSDFRRQSL